MNNKEFTAELAGKLGYTLKDTSEWMAALTSKMAAHWQEGDTIAVQGFGTFEVKKKLERITVNPATKLRMLIPPKLVLSYKPSNVLKEKFK